jgi:hypothetical protein
VFFFILFIDFDSKIDSVQKLLKKLENSFDHQNERRKEVEEGYL